MKCKRIQKWLPLHAGRDLDGIRGRLVERHLAGCADCRSECDTLVSVRRISRQALLSRMIKSGSVHWSGLAARLENMPESIDRKTVRHKHFRLAFNAVGMILAVLIILWTRHTPQKKAQSDYLNLKKQLPPIVEAVHMEHVTLVTFETNNPHLTIVWFFQDGSINAKSGGGT
jgi:hypothetical protein